MRARIPHLLAATVLTLSLCACTAHSKPTPPSGIGPVGPTTTTVGSAITVDVEAGDSFSVDVPGVGSIAGDAGAVAGSGQLVVQPIAATFPADSYLSSAGHGIDVSLRGVTLVAPLTVSFVGGEQSGGLAPVVAHQLDDGTWEIKAAAIGSDGRIVLNTQSFSINVPAWLNPRAWLRALGAKAASFFGGRSSPLTCSGAPAWAGLVSASTSVHTCITTASPDASHSAARVELQIKSNRGYSQQIEIPGTPDYVWVEGQPYVLRKATSWAYGLDPDRSVILPAGSTMTMGFSRPSNDVNLVGRVHVTYASTAASVVDMALQYVLGLAADEAHVALPYVLAKCVSGINFGTGAIDLHSATFGSVFSCVFSDVIQGLADPAKAVGAAQDLVGNTAENLSRDEAAALLTKVGRAAQKVGYIALLWPVLRDSWTQFADALGALVTENDSTQVTLSLTAASTPPGGSPGGTPPAAAVLPEEPTGPSVTSSTTTSATLRWTDASNNEDSFVSQYRIGSGAWLAGPYVGPNTTSMTVNGLAAGTSYTFQIGARNAAGTHWSAYFYGTTANPSAAYHAGFAATVDKYATTGLSGHKGPGDQYAAGPTYPVGTTIHIYCYVNGQSITNSHYSYTTTIWDLADDGYWYTDAWLYTGVNGAVVPACR